MSEHHAGALRPHRAVLVLVLGIISLVTSCFPLGIVAWVLGHSDIRDMDAGLMDPEGRGMTLAGKILGIVSVALWVVSFVVTILIMVIIGIGAAAGAAAQTGTFAIAAS